MPFDLIRKFQSISSDNKARLSKESRQFGINGKNYDNSALRPDREELKHPLLMQLRVLSHHRVLFLFWFSGQINSRPIIRFT